MKQKSININSNNNNSEKGKKKAKITINNNNKKNNINKGQSKIHTKAQKNISHVNKRITLKLIKQMKVLPISIAGIYFLKNGNFLVLGRKEFDKLFEYMGDSGIIKYKIFDNKLQMIKKSKKDLNISIRNIKVIDENNIFLKIFF